jgi:AcrR family transcriptional regulator
MKQGRRKRSGRRSVARERVLDAALQVFAEKGFSAATTRDIAKAADVNEVTLFRHFETKGALFAAVLSERSPLVEISKTVSFDIEGRIEDVVVGSVKTVLKVLRSNRHLFMVLIGDAWRQPNVRPVVGEQTFRRGLDFLMDFMEAQMDAGRLRRMDPEVPARALMGMVQSYFINNDLLEGRRPDAAKEEKLIRGFVSVFLDGARAEVGGGSR